LIFFDSNSFFALNNYTEHHKLSIFVMYHVARLFSGVAQYFSRNRNDKSAVSNGAKSI